MLACTDMAPSGLRNSAGSGSANETIDFPPDAFVVRGNDTSPSRDPLILESVVDAVTHFVCVLLGMRSQKSLWLKLRRGPFLTSEGKGGLGKLLRVLFFGRFITHTLCLLPGKLLVNKFSDCLATPTTI